MNGQWVDQVWRAGLAIDPAMSVSEWADRHRILSNLSAEPGPWRTARAPFLRDVMDALGPEDPHETVVLMKGSQVGATEAGLNFVGFCMEHVGGVLLLVMPSLSDIRRNTRVRIDPMIDAAPSLRAIVATPRSKSGANTIFEKSFRGGRLFMTGANSASALASTPVRFIVADEVDRWPLELSGEGDPLSLVRQRTVTFRGTRKIFVASTPTLKGLSRIEAAFAEGDQRRYFVPCPHCGDMAVVTWERIRWPEGQPDQAACVCDACGALATEADKHAMIAAAEWRATAEGDGRTVSFHLPALLSPFESWAEVAVAYLAAKDDPARLQTFVNLKLGEPWEDAATAPVFADALVARAEPCDVPWSELLPDGAAVLTVGADIQADRVELETIAWGKGEESWSIAYDIIAGDTSREEVWQALDRLLLRRFRHPRAIPDLHVAAAAVDAGYLTPQVSAFSAPRLPRRVWAIRGRGGPGQRPWPRVPPKPRRAGLAPLFFVGVDGIKQALMARLRLAEPAGPGVVHAPSDRDLSWFQQLVSERPIRRFVRGVPRIEWLHDRSVRNEALDARCYGAAALAGLRAHGLDLDAVAAKVGAAAFRTDATAAVAKPAPTVIRSQWMDR
jgi:phage terminase large subunit GpA-like protein